MASPAITPTPSLKECSEQWRNLSPSPRKTILRKISYINFIPQTPDHINIDNDDNYILNQIKNSTIVTTTRRFITRHSRPDYVLCGLSKKNKWRKRVKTLVNSKWFFIFISIVVLLNSLVLALYTPYIAEDFEEKNLIYAYVTIVFELIYIIEAVLRVVSAGFILHRSSYTRSVENILDICVILIGLAYIGARRGYLVEVLSTLMSIRLLRILGRFKSVQFILKALGHSLLPLLHLGLFIFCVLVFFSLFGIELYSGDLHFGCFVNYTNRLGISDRYLVSEFPCSSDNRPGSHQCDQVEGRSYCGVWSVGPNSGLVGFDNLAIAMLTVFQCMTLEGWTSVLYLYESTRGVYFVWTYFVVLIIFGSLLILNLFLGVLTSVFIGVSDRQQERGDILVLKEKRKIEEELTGYRAWLKIAAEEDDNVKNSRSHADVNKQLSPDSTSSVVVDSDSDEGDEEDNIIPEEFFNSKWYKVLVRVRRTRALVHKVVKSHVFFWFMIVIILLNLFVLLCDHYPAPSWLDNTIKIINYIFTSVYIVEMCLKLYGLGIKKYFIPNFNKLNFFLTSINILDLLVLYHISAIKVSVSHIVNAVRAFRLISAFKYTRYWHGMNAIVNAFSNIWSTMLSLLALLGVYLVLVSLIGMRLFQLRLSIPGLSHPSFNDFVSAMLLAFQLATTEDWHVVMYSTAYSFQYSPAQIDLRWAIGAYYLLAIIIGGLILANIFLAIAVDKLLEVNELEKDVTKRVEQREEQRREREKQLDVLKNCSEPSGLGKTLKKIVTLYALSVDQEEIRKRRQKQQRAKRRLGSEIKQERSASLTPPSPPISALERRRIFGRAGSDPLPGLLSIDSASSIERGFEDETRGLFPFKSGIHPRKVLLMNPLRKAVESIDVQSTPDPTENKKPMSDPPTEMSEDSLTHHETDSPFASKSGRSVMDPDLTRDAHVILANPNSPVLVPGATPMPVLNNTSPNLSGSDNGEDASISRLVRKSSLEEISSVPVPTCRTDSRTVKDNTRVKFNSFCSSCKARAVRVKDWAKDYFGSIELDPRNELKEIPNHSTLFVIAPDNRFRLWCYDIVKSKAFQTLSITITVLSTIILALESPIPVTGDIYCTLQETVLHFDLLILTWFLLEMILKVLVLGFFVHRGSYLHGLFNIIDFNVIIVTIIPIVVYFMYIDENVECYSYSQQIPSYYTFVKLLRVARPIRTLRITGLYLVAGGLLASLKKMGHILFIGLLWLVIFAVVGVQCFKGRFFYCSDFMTAYEEDCKGNYFLYPSEDLNCPQVLTRTWNKWKLNFDNIFTSLLTLFTMLTKEGWQEVMYHAIDSTDQARGPKHNASRESLIYFILYMIGVTFFLLNFVVGFIIVTFQRVGIKAYKDSNLDRNQRNCLYIALTVPHKKNYVPTGRCHRVCYWVIRSSIMKGVVFFAILANTAVLAIQHYQMSDALKLSVYWINAGFTVFFTAEVVLRLIVLTPSEYFRSVSRVLEFLIVVGSILELVLQRTIPLVKTFQFSHVASTFRVLRLNIIAKGTKLVIWTLLRSLEIFPWIGVFLVMILYTYAVLGMQIFGQIEVTSIDNQPVNAIHQYNNFQSFPQAMLVMIRSFTGENWERIMLSCVNASCQEGINSTSCGSPAAYVFFPVLFFISSILVLNLFVSIIIDNFDYYIRDKSILGSHHLRDFPSLWAKFEDTRCGKLDHARVIDMMKLVEPPLGWGKLCPQITAYKKMMRLNIPLLEDGTVAFNATLFAIVRQSLKINTSGNITEDNTDLKNKLRNVFPNIGKKMLDSVIPEKKDFTTGKLYGALVIQYHWRGRKISKQKMEAYKLHRRMSILPFHHLPDMGRDLITRRRDTMVPGLPLIINTIDEDSSPEFQLPSDPPPNTQRASKRPPFLVHLDTIDETADLAVSKDSSPREATPTSSTSISPPLNSSRLQSRKVSIVSESDMFVTPTGSLISLEEYADQAHSDHTHHTQLLHSLEEYADQAHSDHTHHTQLLHSDSFKESAV